MSKPFIPPIRTGYKIYDILQHVRDTIEKNREAPTMSIKKYEVLLQTADLGSFTKASEVLGYTQSRCV